MVLLRDSNKLAGMATVNCFHAELKRTVDHTIDGAMVYRCASKDCGLVFAVRVIEETAAVPGEITVPLLEISFRARCRAFTSLMSKNLIIDLCVGGGRCRESPSTGPEPRVYQQPGYPTEVFAQRRTADCECSQYSGVRS